MVRTRRASRTRLSPFQAFYLWAIAAVAVGPFLPLLVQSFAFRWDWPNLLPTEWWFSSRERARLPQGWDYLLSPYSRLAEAAFNTVAIGLVVALLSLAICLPAARVLARMEFRGKPAFEFFLSLPLVIPESAIGIALLMIFIHLGLAGSLVGVVLAQLIPTVPYMVRMLTAVYQGLGAEFEEQSYVLGAGRWQTYRLVTLPMLMPGIVAGCLFAFLVSTNIFLLTFFLGQGRIVTLPTLLFAKISSSALDASAAGLALLVSLPGIVLLIVSDRFIREEAFGKGFGS